MRHIFIGLLLVFLDFTLDFNASKIGLIPDFVGYIYILKGLDELVEHSDWFTKLRSFTVGMAIYAGVLYVMDLLGISASLGMIAFLLGLVSTIIALYISYGIVMAVKDMEMAQNRNLNADTLYSIWRILAVVSIAMFFVIFIPVLNLVGLILGLIINIYFIYSFSISKNLFYQ